MQAWQEGALSNLDYLLFLNNLAGRRRGDLKFYPIVPWVIDTTVDPRSPERSDSGAPGVEPSCSGWRDLSRTKYRLAKGDEQLDFTYRTSDVPHHVSDEQLSELTCCIYLARRLPEGLLTSVVRKVFEPNEYPQSLQRLYSWTPDEAIPEFYTDPDVFVSAHEGMRDIELPGWCASPSEFVRAHREALESPRVSALLHTWIDLAFGYQLSGDAAFQAKNVALPPSARRKNGGGDFCRRGHYQIFRRAHPQRGCGPMQFPSSAAGGGHDEGGFGESQRRLKSLEFSAAPGGAVKAESWPSHTARSRPAGPSASIDLESIGGLALAMCTRQPEDIIAADVPSRTVALDISEKAAGLGELPTKTAALVRACVDGSASAEDLVGSNVFKRFHFETLELVRCAGVGSGSLAELRSVADHLLCEDRSPDSSRLGFCALSRVVLAAIEGVSGEVAAYQVSLQAATIIDWCVRQALPEDVTLKEFLLELVTLCLGLPLAALPIQEMLFEGGRWTAIYGGLGEGLYYKSVQPKVFALIGRASNDRLTRVLVRAVVSVCQKAPLPVVLYQCLRPGLACMAVNEKISILLTSLFKEIPNAGLRLLMVQQLVEILSVPPHLMQRATGAPDQRQTLKARSRAMLGALVTLDHVLEDLEHDLIETFVLGRGSDSGQCYCDLLTLLMTPFPDLQVVCRAALLLIRATDAVGGPKAVLADVLPEVRALVFVSTSERDLFDELEVTAQNETGDTGKDAAVVIPEGHKYLLSVVYHGLAIIVGIEELHAAIPIWAEIESYIADTSGEGALPWEGKLAGTGTAEPVLPGWEWLCRGPEPLGLDFGDLKTGSTSTVAQSVRDRPWTIQASVEHSWKAHAQDLGALAVGGGGNVLLTAGRDMPGASGGAQSGADVVKVWDWATSVCSNEYSLHEERVVGLHFLDSGCRAASCDAAALHLWNVETCEQLAVFQLNAHTQGRAPLQPSPSPLSYSRKRSPSASPQSSASPLPPSLNEVSPATTFSQQSLTAASEFTCCAVSPASDLHRLVAGTSEGFLQEFDVSRGKRLSLWKVSRGAAAAHSNRVLAVALQPAGAATVACGLASGHACALDSRTGLPVFRLRAHGGGVSAVAWHDDSRVLTGGADRMISLWDCRMLRDGGAQCIQSFQGHKDALQGFSLRGSDVLSYAGSRIAVGTLSPGGVPSSPVHLAPVKVQGEKDGLDGRICAASLLPSWHHFVLGTEDGAVKVCS
jgi:hypothetical protein